MVVVRGLRGKRKRKTATSKYLLSVSRLFIPMYKSDTCKQEPVKQSNKNHQDIQNGH